jgi:hypothetical protein
MVRGFNSQRNGRSESCSEFVTALSFSPLTADATGSGSTPTIVTFNLAIAVGGCISTAHGATDLLAAGWRGGGVWPTGRPRLLYVATAVLRTVFGAIRFASDPATRRLGRFIVVNGVHQDIRVNGVHAVRLACHVARPNEWDARRSTS